jgi:CBS domain containing-hemolysin-like protein
MTAFVAAVTTALVVSFMCSIFESVLLSIGHAHVEGLAQRGKRAGRLLSRFKRNIDVPIAAILIVNTIAHTIGAAVAGATYSDVFDPGTLWIFSIVFTLAVLLFTEIIPKTLGVTYARGLAVPVAHGIHFLTVALKPLVWISERISRALRGGATVPVTSVEEIRLLAALGRSEGVVGVRTAGMIMGAAQLRELQAGDALVPRQRVAYLWRGASRAEAVAILRESGHSRFPFSTGDELDQAAGIVLAKDLLFWLQEHPEGPIDWDALVHETLMIPETKSLASLLRDFQEARRHMAIVFDEYGDVQGIVTLEDVLEEIVGEIVDEFDRPVEDLWPQPDGSWLARASVDLRRLSSKLGVALAPDQPANTLGGLVNELLGRLPKRGDVVQWQGFRLEVMSAAKTHAEVIGIRALSRSAAADAEE